MAKRLRVDQLRIAFLGALQTLQTRSIALRLTPPLLSCLCHL